MAYWIIALKIIRTCTACIFFFFYAEAEAPILWPPDEKSQLWKSWEELKAGGEGDDRG